MIISLEYQKNNDYNYTIINNCQHNQKDIRLLMAKKVIGLLKDTVDPEVYEVNFVFST